MKCLAFGLMFFACITLASCTEVKFKDCGSKSGKPTHVYVTPCMTPSSCVLHKGTNSTISVSFIPNGVTTKVTAVVHGVIAGIAVPFPMEGTDGCVKSGLTCPLKGGVEVKYSKELPVKTVYPSLKLLVKWELQDQNKLDLVCVEIPAQIQ